MYYAFKQLLYTNSKKNGLISLHANSNLWKNIGYTGLNLISFVLLIKNQKKHNIGSLNFFLEINKDFISISEQKFDESLL